MWNLAELTRAQIDEDRRAETLQHLSEVIAEHVRQREHVVQRLLAGQLSLVEAARRFRSLNAELPGYAHTAIDSFRGQSEGERCCRQVIRWVESSASVPTPSQIEEVLRGLEAELAAHLVEHDGVVILPKS